MEVSPTMQAIHLRTLTTILLALTISVCSADAQSKGEKKPKQEDGVDLFRKVFSGEQFEHDPKASLKHDPKALQNARKGFKTKLTRKVSDDEPVSTPPRDQFRTVKYKGPLGDMSAYVSVVPKEGKKRPAIIWITGGDCNSVGEVWKPRPAENDQSASAYRTAGIVMMFPFLRGANGNPGVREGFLGEVDDILAAGEYLRKRPEVDPNRVYLGGHSTGGTLVMLVAEHPNKFRAVFSFGPVTSPSGYGDEYCPFDLGNKKEDDLRSPGLWLHSISTPLFAFEGEQSPGNATSLIGLRSRNSTMGGAESSKFFLVPNHDHFNILAPMNKLIARKILADKGDECNIEFSDAELRK